MDQECQPLEQLVDKDNFAKIYQFISDQKLIEKSEFIAFDLEMTGIKGDYQDYFEEPLFERYLKLNNQLRKVAMKFTIIQIGLCFNIKNAVDQYESFPFTFYVFPGEEDRIIGMQVGSVQFNTLHGMDWNRWIAKGINYQNEKNEEKLNQKIEIEVTGDQKSQIDRAEKAKFDEETYKQMQEKMTEHDKQKFSQIETDIESFALNQDDCISFVNLNAYQKKFLYSLVGFKYPEIYPKSFPEGEFILRKLNAEEQQIEEEKTKREKLDKLEQTIGFTKLWKDIVNAKKIMVGHNCHADIAFIYSHFVDQLPINYEQFKLEIIKKLPLYKNSLYFTRIYDTKYVFGICDSLKELRGKIDTSTKLEHLQQLFTKQTDIRQIKLEISNKYKSNNDISYHTAGYDAYATSFVFAYLYSMISEEEKQQTLNQLNAFRSIFSINLQGEDKLICDSTYYFIKLPEKKNIPNLRQYSQDCQNFIEDKLSFLKSNPLVYSRIINFKFYSIEIKSSCSEQNEIEKQIRTFCNEQKDYNFLTYQQYEKLRRDIKEKEANYDRFDKK